MSVFDVLFRMAATGGDAVRGEADKARKSFGRLRVEADKTGKAAQALGGRFGELHGRAEALTDAFGAGALKYAAAGAGLIAVSVAAKAAATAAYDVSAAIVDINRNASEMLDKLTATEKHLLKGLEFGALNAEKELAALDRTLLALQLRVGAEFAPAVAKGAKALRGLTEGLLALTPAGVLGSLPDNILTIGAAIGGPFLKNLRASANVAGILVNALAYLAGPISDTIEPINLSKATTPTGRVHADAPMDPEAIFGPKDKKRNKSAKEYEGTLLSIVELTQQWMRDQEGIADLTERITGSVRESAEDGTFSESFGGLSFSLNNELTESEKGLQDFRLRQLESATAIVGQVRDVTAQAGASITNLIRATGNDSKASMKAMAKASRAFAIMDIQLKTAMTIMSSAMIGYPQNIPGIAAAVALGAVETAAVLATPLPQFHTGGAQRFTGDDEGIVSKRVRAGEFDTTFTPEGFRAAGGADGIARMNAGQSHMGVSEMVFVVEDERFKVRGMAKPDAGYGHRR